MTPDIFAQKVIDGFTANPSVNVLFITGDGQCFLKPGDAGNHCKDIGKDKPEWSKYLKVHRDQVNDIVNLATNNTEIAENVAAAVVAAKEEADKAAAAEAAAKEEADKAAAKEEADKAAAAEAAAKEEADKAAAAKKNCRN